MLFIAWLIQAIAADLQGARLPGYLYISLHNSVLEFSRVGRCFGDTYVLMIP